MLTWTDGDSDATVQFLVQLIMPKDVTADDADLTCLPVAVYFHSNGETVTDVFQMWREWTRIAPEPFLLVCPCQPENYWWFIDNDSDYGWVKGAFSSETVQLYCKWLDALSMFPRVATTRIGLFGWSAGAYAVTEILAAGCIPLSGVGLGGVHGHGQSNLEGLPPQFASIARPKFDAYLKRLKEMSGVPWIEATHGITDTESKWADAQAIFEALTEAQQAGLNPEVSVRALEPEEQDVRPKSKKNKTHHNYFNASFVRAEFFVALFGGELPDHKAFLNREKPEQTWDRAPKKKPKTEVTPASAASWAGTTASAASWAGTTERWSDPSTLDDVPSYMDVMWAIMSSSGDGGWNGSSATSASTGAWQSKGSNKTRRVLQEDPITGIVSEWKGTYGWVKPDEAIAHPLSAKHQGDVYIAKKDIMGTQEPKVGDAVSFVLYSDSTGLGGQQCTLCMGIVGELG